MNKIIIIKSFQIKKNSLFNYRINSYKKICFTKKGNFSNNKTIILNLRNKNSLKPANIFEKYKKRKSKKSTLYFNQMVVNKNTT